MRTYTTPPDLLGLYTSYLVVETATASDRGEFECRAADWDQTVRASVYLEGEEHGVDPLRKVLCRPRSFGDGFSASFAPVDPLRRERWTPRLEIGVPLPRPWTPEGFRVARNHGPPSARAVDPQIGDGGPTALSLDPY